MKKLRPIVFVGTGSDVGKSVINAAFCRIFKQDGYSPAPFKAQNMSLNSFATPEGLEIGRAQAMQAEACGIACRSDMNPILLKPTNATSAQVVLNGKPAGNQTAFSYFNQTDRIALFDQAMQACYRLAEEYNPIVVEGAGSISEVNLWDRDITNMRVAEALDAPAILVADIDRGGVFASVYGSIQLLPPEHRRLIKGVLINKFRGDRRLFDDGVRMLEELCGVPVLGVIPYFREIYLDQEDSVVLDRFSSPDNGGKVRVAVVLVPHMSNFTDFNLLERHPDILLTYVKTPDELRSADVVILPGSKNTMDDLQYLRRTGMAQAVLQQHEAGKTVCGICGGYQMMGLSIEDPQGIEGDVRSLPGLGILPVTTILTPVKKTIAGTFRLLDDPTECTGYEIHMGETQALSPSPLCTLQDGQSDGYYLNEKTFGTYLHGFFDQESTIAFLLKSTGHASGGSAESFNPAAFREEQYDKLADHVRQHVNLEAVYQMMQP